MTGILSETKIVWKNISRNVHCHRRVLFHGISMDIPMAIPAAIPKGITMGIPMDLPMGIPMVPKMF
jgi:hypothetical protein